jgi:hypothetical protein
MNLVPSGLTAEQIEEAKRNATPVEPPVEEYTGPYWKTRLINERPDEEVPVRSSTGRVIMVLPPKKEIVICIWDPSNIYAPLEKVVWEKGGKISTTRRSGFEDPVDQAPFSILLDNRDGAESESIKISDQYVEVIKGIPRRVAVDIRIDPLAIYKAVQWVKKTVKEPIPGNKNYLITRQIIEKILVPRKKSEIKAIKKLLEAEAVETARKDAERRFNGVEGGPEEAVEEA